MKLNVRGPQVGLILILVLEIWIFSGAFNAFFNHDSLFYLIHAPRSWDQLIQVMTGPDPTHQFRPMTLAVMGIILPLFRLDPLPYHFVPIAFHAFNTILFWLLARRLLSSSTGALVATAFWGLHSVAAFVTYDIGYLPDFLMAFFALLSLIFAIDAAGAHSRRKTLVALLFYLGALLSKEAMVALPLAVLVCLMVMALRRDTQRTGGSRLLGALRTALPLTGLYLGTALVYAGLLAFWLQSGRLYTQGASEAYNINPLSNLAGKVHYLVWALNLPDALSVPHPNLNRALILLLMAVLPGVWGAGLLRRRGRSSPVELGGIVWLLGMLIPACMLSSRTAKWYLYVPLMGLALVFGAAAADLKRVAARWSQRIAGPAVVALFLLPVLYSSRVQNLSFLRSSDPSYASSVVHNCLRDFQKLQPSLPQTVTLFMLRTYESNVAAFFGGGELFSMYNPERRIQMLFADQGARLPEDFAERSDIRILRYLYGHIYDVTAYYKGRRLDSCSKKLVTELSEVESSVNRQEFYPNYEDFGTPGGTPVFFPAPGNDILTQIGGSEAVVEMGEIPPEAQLRFDISWMHDQGDGGWAELAVRTDGRDETLFQEYMERNPAGEGFRWREVTLNLAPFKGMKLDLVLRCRNASGNNTIADWLNWRDIRLESPAFHGPNCGIEK